MPRTKKPDPKQPLVIRSHALTPDQDEFLKRLSQEASDTLGWSVSSSALVRALIRFMKEHRKLASESLFPLVEQELTEGRVWGRRQK